jgi:hypothetical protein
MLLRKLENTEGVPDILNRGKTHNLFSCAIYIQKMPDLK